MAQQLEDDFYTVAEAARVLRVSVSTVWRWIDSGRLPAYRVGQRRIRIRTQDLRTIVRPFREGARARRAGRTEPIELVPMFPTEAEDQMAVIEKLRAFQEEILARRGGKLFPPSWIDINEAREERSRELDNT